MLSECNFKNELSNISKSIRRFYERDLEIRRACHHCTTDMNQNDCILFQIYKQRVLDIELNKLPDEINNKLLDEINNKKREILNLQHEINEFENQRENKVKEIKILNKEIEIYNNKAIKIRANDFLRATIGEENYIFLKNNGYFDIKGTNNSTYRVTSDGKISKLKTEKSLIDRIKDATTTNYHQNKRCDTWEGKIRVGDYPLEDAIAVVYMNIMKDSYRFDKDKGCGSIFIR